MSERFYLYDDTEPTKTRFVSFMGENQRYDLAVLYTDRHFGKMIVMDMQGSRFAIIGQDDLDEPGYLEQVFRFNEEEAEELREFLNEFV